MILNDQHSFTHCIDLRSKDTTLKHRYVFSSMALGDINGDGDADLCIGSTLGIKCYDMQDDANMLFNTSTLRSLDSDTEDLTYPISADSRVLSFRYSNKGDTITYDGDCSAGCDGFPVKDGDKADFKSRSVYRCNDALVALGDVNDDGIVDLLVGSSAFEGIKVYLNKNHSTCH